MSEKFKLGDKSKFILKCINSDIMMNTKRMTGLTLQIPEARVNFIFGFSQVIFS